VLLGEWGMRLTLSSIPVETPVLDGLPPRSPRRGHRAAVSIVSGILFGLAPALHVTAGDLLSPLREAPRLAVTRRRASASRNLLVSAEVALAVVLLIGSGLMIPQLPANAGSAERIAHRRTC
jgi:hypothetical protein